MNRLRIGSSTALVAMLVIVSAATARTNGVEGKIEGDSNSKVTAKILIEDRVPTRVLDLRFRKVDFDCASGAMLEGSVEAPDRVPVKKNGNFETRNEDIEIAGTVKLKGRKIVGKVEAELKFNGDPCKAKGSFKAR